MNSLVATEIVECPGCRTQVEKSRRICSNCGASLREAVSASSPISVPPSLENYVNRTQGYLITGLLAFLVLLGAWNVFKPVPIQKWEYKIESVPDSLFEAGMEGLGSNGWELVSARRANSGYGSASDVSYEMIFKRPKH